MLAEDDLTLKTGPGWINLSLFLLTVYFIYFLYRHYRYINICIHKHICTHTDMFHLLNVTSFIVILNRPKETIRERIVQNS